MTIPNTLLGNTNYILAPWSIGLARLIETVRSTFLSRLLTDIYGDDETVSSPANAYIVES